MRWKIRCCKKLHLYRAEEHGKEKETIEVDIPNVSKINITKTDGVSTT